MKKYNQKGSIVFIVLCLNMWCAVLTILLIQVVGLTQYVAAKHIHIFLNECRFNLLIDIAKKYIQQSKREEMYEGTIFDNEIIIENVDRFKGKIKLLFKEKKYDITAIVYTKERKIIMKKTL